MSFKLDSTEMLAVAAFNIMEDVKFETVENMRKYGGSFVQSLAECFSRADSENTMKLSIAFANYIVEYSPEKWKPKT